MSPSEIVSMETPAKVRRLNRPAVSSWSRLNRSSDSASTTSTSFRSADCIIAWKPGRISDAPDNGRLLVYDLALTRCDDAVLEATNDTVAVAQTATGLAVLDASAEPSARLVGELLQEHRVHRPLEADVQERDVAFRERDDADAGESESLEQAGGVLLVAAESIERFSEHDVDLLAKRRLHHRLKT